ncbi:acetolactate synthase catalytic subunit [Loigolactobacillus backii]|uniref:biosynthetic-type acetolactate synthase large subunit n=1 Tax=Loigolactobacillus backii TaxID=375175 RepID=UPI0007F15BBB|nr:biosynthetic-type acetolactate synthase large subunit [Loigolactobacillus backii]ANK60837.1 acetolactate synthase catalytic subunit [Loigolactobacillus backii]ANK65790.1 acetolactate synthase catalytic subunit [Loigolactobacillus backii]ANK68267.1 acetolactate synthase catalytic subunit [Loigolactobacillus backii]OLF70058.1 acetolactate synthase catalytic subunit [Loigolactobacillus backii]PIO86525.1 acetolactate synthase, large subunit, biosynthetic type [Loigolactobacillus backii]
MLEKETQSNVQQQTGATVLLTALKKQNVNLLFGYPGGAVLPLYDALYQMKFQNILVRHEQGAVHAAEGYAKVTGKPGVVFVTSGPGATNAMTGLANAMSDSTPIVVFTGQVGVGAIGTDAFQEADVLSMTAPVTKNNYQVRRVADLPRIVAEAFRVATTGRKGPVVVDLPKSVTQEQVTELTDDQVHLTSYQAKRPLDQAAMDEMLLALRQASKPVILAGGGIGAAQASTELRKFSKDFQLPVVASLLGLGDMPTDEPLFLGMGGMHGTYTANMALTECDFLLCIGARFDDRLATAPKQFAPNAKIAHIDIDPAELGKVIAADYPIVADAKVALEYCLAQPMKPAHDQTWLQLLQQRKAAHPYSYQESSTELKPQRVIELVGRLTKGDATVVTDVGQHQMWTAQFYPFSRPQQLITSGGLGTMGFGLPAAIGAAFATPDKTVVLFVGDGGLQMTSEELDVLAAYDLNVKVILLNNGTLGMVRQWQDLFYEKRRSQTVFDHQPDFMKLAAAYGLRHLKVTSPVTVAAELERAFSSPHAMLIEADIPALEQVFPMIAPGKSNDQMIGVK